MCVDVRHSNGNIAIEEEIVSHHGRRFCAYFLIKKLKRIYVSFLRFKRLLRIMFIISLYSKKSI